MKEPKYNPTVETNLRQDELIYGLSLCRVDEEGNKTRIPPADWEKVLKASNLDENRDGR